MFGILVTWVNHKPLDHTGQGKSLEKLIPAVLGNTYADLGQSEKARESRMAAEEEMVSGDMEGSLMENSQNDVRRTSFTELLF